VLGINSDPVTIKQVEVEIIHRAFASGWVVPLHPSSQSGRRVAVIGSGPAALAAAQQLTRAGHAVTVFERDDAPGGLLRYGIPEFKLEKLRFPWKSSTVTTDPSAVRTRETTTRGTAGAAAPGPGRAGELARSAEAAGRPPWAPGGAIAWEQPQAAATLMMATTAAARTVRSLRLVLSTCPACGVTVKGW
jgi:hypothetical protein